MANILFTTYCNRNCVYCFAKGKVDLNKEKGDPSKNLSLAGLEKIIAFYKKSLLRRFVILGGEPTLHPDFPLLVDRVLAEPSFKSIIVFTNGLLPSTVQEYFMSQQDDRLRIAMNLNAPDAYSADQWEHITSTLKRLGGRVGLGINIYAPGQDYAYLIDAIQTYNLTPHVRLGLTHPIPGNANRFAHRADFPAIAEDIVSFARDADANNIHFSFDCGFEFCMFSLEQHKELLRCGIKFMSRCDPIVDIGPDLSVWHCFPLLNYVCGDLDQFDTRMDVVDHYENKYKNIKCMGSRRECPQCRYRTAQLCSGGCLARALGSFQRQ